MTPGAMYARYSTDEQDPRSIDDQFRRCREVAKRTEIHIVHTFSDAAISGSHSQRPDLQALLAMAREKRPPFRIVLIDDLSRLSRDLGQTWSIVFDQLAASDIVVLDCNTGMRSDAPGARTMFAAMGMVNDTFLQLVRTETHRGLQGRALAGFWTGGKVYGYATKPEETPQDIEHPRMVPVIDPSEAAIVRRVFALFLKGAGLKSIADQLNREGIPAPHDGGTGHKIGRGWNHSTIRNMLRNDRYIGRWTWNTSKWITNSQTGKRRRIERPRSEHVVKDIPELAIIDKATWDAVTAKLRKQTKRGGRPNGTGKRSYLTSGLLRCGACAGSMSVIGQKMKAGVRYATFGCSAHYSRGASICPNTLTVSERRVTTALIESLRELFTTPAVIRRMTESIGSKITRASKTSAIKPTETLIEQAEQRVRNLTSALAARPSSAAILERLDEEERRLAELQAARRAPKTGPSLKAPTEKQVAGFLTNLVDSLEADPVAGRGALADIMGPLTLSPTAAPRGYRCHAEVRFSSNGAVGSSAPLLEKSSSGGAIRQCIYRVLLRSRRRKPDWQEDLVLYFFFLVSFPVPHVPASECLLL